MTNVIARSPTARIAWVSAGAICLFTVENVWIDPFIQHRLPSLVPDALGGVWFFALMALGTILILAVYCQVLLMRDEKFAPRKKALTGIIVVAAAALACKWFLATGGMTIVEGMHLHQGLRTVMRQWHASPTTNTRYNIYQGPRTGLLEDSEDGSKIRTVNKAEQPLCGMPDDVQPHLPTDKEGKVNWDTFVPPSKGQSYVDPVFGCTVRRLTEDSFSYHDYSTTEALSANDSYVLVGDNGAMRVVDLYGNVVVDGAHMPVHNNGHFVWDSKAGNKFYYALNNSLRIGTIRARNSVAAATVHVFREYPNWITIMDYANVSTDGDHIALVGENPSARGVATIEFFTFQLSTKEKSYTFNSSEQGCVVMHAPAELGGQPGGDCMHKLLLTADNRPAMEWHPNGDPRMPTGCVVAFAAGASCKTVTNADGSLKMIQSGTTHMDSGWDITGKESVIIQDFDPDPNGTHQNDPCYDQGGISVKNVNTLALTCLLSMNFRAGHVSYFGGPDQPWVTVDVEDGRNPGPEWYNTHSENYAAPTQPCLQQGTTIAPHCWTLYESEILLVRVDNVGNPTGLGGAKGKTFRLAHTRSRHEENYYAQPRASLSRDGRFIVFDSNMAHPDGKCGGRSANGCADVYLLGPLF